MADQIITRFGALDSQLATAVRHALDVAVTLTALAPMNDVHLRLIAMDEIVDADCGIPDPPSHKWHELMAELFGRNVPVFQRLPSSRPDAIIEFAEAYPVNESERRVIGSLLAACGAFIIAESIALSDAVRGRNVYAGRETFVGDDLISALQRASQVGLSLIDNSGADTWWNFLFRQDAPPAAVPTRQPRNPTTTAGSLHGIRPRNGSAGVARRIAPRHWRTICRSIIGVSMVILGVFGYAIAPDLLPNRSAGATSLHMLEKPDLKLSIMTTTDLAPFWLAVQRGYFRDAGFTFDPLNDVKIAKSGAESVRMLAEHKVDIAYSTYTPFIVAQSRGAADLKLVAAASVAGPSSCMVVVMPGSKIKEIKDLRKARIAVTARNTISELMVESALKTNGVDYKAVQWVEVPFEEMAEKLAVGQLDAAFMTEPFLSQAANSIGAVPLLDTAVGPTMNLATAGFGINAAFARKYPKTTAAFQDVMRRATLDANSDRSTVEPMLVQHASVDENTAKLPSLLTFKSALERDQVQRVADLMRDFKMIPTSIDVSRMMALTLVPR